MPLLSLEEIQQELDRKFLPLPEFMWNGRLRSGGVSDSALAECEKALGRKLPSAFCTLIQAYDFGDLTLGPVMFSFNGDYLQRLIDLNVGKYSWGCIGCPANLITVALSDPYSILLDTVHGTVHAHDPDLEWDQITHIASGFDTYFRGLAMAMVRLGKVEDSEAFAQQLLADVGGTDMRYWRTMAGGRNPPR